MWLGLGLLSLLSAPTLIADGTQSGTAPHRLVHFSSAGSPAYGFIDNNTITPLVGDLFSGDYRAGSGSLALESVILLPATTPSKIIAVGLNYRSHMFSSRGDVPRLFSKLPSSLSGDGDPIWLYPDSTNLHYEGELVVIIGKTARNISVSEAPEYIFGVSAGNDVTDRSWQSSDLQWIRAKGADSFSPLAPWILRGADYNDLLVQTRVNGEVVQSESTKNLLFSVDEIVSYASHYFTLNPGDLIYSGTPGSTRRLSAGDVVEVSVQGVGAVTNRVIQRPPKPQ